MAVLKIKECACPCTALRMAPADVDRWLTDVNGATGRGSEFRTAEAIQKKNSEKGAPPGLSLEDFIDVYREVCEEGKYWSVEYDLMVMLGRGTRVEGDAFAQRFDRIYAGTFVASSILSK